MCYLSVSACERPFCLPALRLTVGSSTLLLICGRDWIVCFPGKVGKFELFDVRLIRRFVCNVSSCLKRLFGDETERRLNSNIQRSFLLICVIRPAKETSIWFLCIGSDSLFYELSVCWKCCRFFISLATYRATCVLLISPLSFLPPPVLKLCVIQFYGSTRTGNVQCESKKSPIRFSEIFSQTVGNF